MRSISSIDEELDERMDAHMVTFDDVWSGDLS